MPEPPPVADAGFDQIRYLGDAESVRVELDGRASCDPMGRTLTDAVWTLLSAPKPAPKLAPTSLLRAGFEAKEPGEYILSLVVIADDRASEPDFLSVRVERGEGEDVVVAPPATNACGEMLPDAEG